MVFSAPYFFCSIGAGTFFWGYLSIEKVIAEFRGVHYVKILTVAATNRDLTVVGVAAFLMIGLVFPCVCHVAIAQSDVTFTPADSFDTPASNGAIRFAVNGTYSQASLINGTWNFENLRLNYSHPLENLKVSAQNSEITIRSYWRFNTTSGSALLSYRVEGQGKQTFNLGLDPERGEWSVVFDEVYMGEGDGWNVSPDGTLTVTGATSSVTIWYYGFPESIIDDGSSNQPLYEQHSVTCATAVAVALTLTFAIAIKIRNQKRLGKTG